MNNVKKYRKEKGLTQSELGDIVGVTSDYISQIERGRVPGIKTAQKLSKLFNKTIEELFLTNKRTKS